MHGLPSLNTGMNEDILIALIERIEILEAQVQAQDDIIKRWEAVHLPTPEEALARMQDRERNGHPWCYSHEESYLLVWGEKKFEQVWSKSAAPYKKSLGLK